MEASKFSEAQITDVDGEEPRTLRSQQFAIPE